MLSLILATLAIQITSIYADAPYANTVIRSGTKWVDTDGNWLHAHGAGFYVEDGVFYMVGATQKLGSAALSEGINLYKSVDLGNWELVGGGPIFRNTSISGFSPGAEGYRIERPKIVKCPGSGKMVMYFHLDTASFSERQVGVVEADSIEGPWRWVRGYQPDGQASLDMTLYVDDGAMGSGQVYLVRSVNNEFAGFSALSSDCHNTTGIVSKGPRVEGQAVFRLPTTHTPFLWGSHLTGWAANPAVFSQASQPSIAGATWQDLGNPSDSPSTWNSQSAYILPLPRTNNPEPLYIYIGDRWNDKGPGGVPNASYVWLPLQHQPNGSWSMPWRGSWRIGDFLE